MSDYTCARCGRTFPRTRPDAEALAECEARWGPRDERSLEIVCEACWRRAMKRYARQAQA